MMKIGMIGLGDIATKAYLPVVNQKNLEVHLFTRNKNKRKEVAGRYRFPHSHESMESLIQSGIKAAFVHTSTASHFEIVEQLLQNNIHVYVDKPVTYDYESTRRLVAMAGKNGLILMGGFNRRFAPGYVQLSNLKDVNMIIMQKNRKSLPGDVRTFVFDDFIHVIDTLLFLFQHDIEKVTVTGRKTKALLNHVVVQFDSPVGATAIGIMNRDSGTVEESIEIFTPSEKWVVRNLTETTIYKNGDSTRQAADDWTSTLYKRGFDQVTDAFLQRVISRTSPDQLHREVLRTHEVCEEVVRQLLV
ncbi:MAG: Gfo/Idh/MocA family oxidoreductase [Cyclobacteriaceae bacterium]